jgi:hypothetical protein
VPALTVGKVTAGVAGAAGASSLGVAVCAALRVIPVRAAAAHARPEPVMWLAAASLATAGLVLGCLGVILDYRVKKLEIAARSAQARAQAELQRMRLDMHRGVLDKATGEPGSAAQYRELIIADALYLSVEQNGMRLADRTHRHLYGPRGTQVPGSQAAGAGDKPTAGH